MATAYSDDLRRKLLEAHQRDEGSLVQLAERFCVSVGWAKKISASLRRTGQMERPAGGRRGPASKITSEIEQELKDWIAQQADLTLAELQFRLYERRKLEISLSRLWMVLKRIGLRRKKSRCMLPSKTPNRAASREPFGAKPAKRSMRRS